MEYKEALVAINGFFFMHAKGHGDTRPRFMRHGTANQYTEQMTDDQYVRYAERFFPIMNRMDYKL